MEVFELRNGLIADYRQYVTSFMAILDTRIRERVETSLREGQLWPDPRVGLNPAFEPGGWIDDLVTDGTLHDACKHIFRAGKGDQDHIGSRMRLHKHQVDAIRAAQQRKNYVLTTGTGSGKSLAYIIPIVDRVLREGSGKGIKAIVVYPMNALANSQIGELDKFLKVGVPAGATVTYGRYTGQETKEQRDELLRNPPDILLTNYVMLELILTRDRDRPLVDAARGLQFLVFDELHTYRGRQGADVAFLARRVREACHANETLQCVGTSATLASGGTLREQRAEIARVASLLFGDDVEPGSVIGETLRRATPPIDPTATETIRQLAERVRAATPPTAYDEFVADPLSSWIEQTFGVTEDEGRLVRCTPRPIKGQGGAAKELAELTATTQNEAERALETQFMGGDAVRHPETNLRVFPFRLHQFISKGDTVYASLDDEATRYLTLQRQTYVPGGRDQVLLPLSFCRECGQEYYTVTRVGDPDEGTEFVPRDLGERAASKTERPGFVYLTSTHPWPDDADAAIERLPDDFVEDHHGAMRVKSAVKKLLPVELTVDGTGRVGHGVQRVWFVPAPFRYCLRCGVAYAGRQRSDFTKLATLGSEGRSTATTIQSLSAVRKLITDPELDPTPEVRKLLSFTDNRQDASLQAGHFNDFVQVGLLRSALLRAVKTRGAQGLRHDELTLDVFRTLDVPFQQYAVDPELKFAARSDTEKALRDVLGYRLYLDQQRGWRITSPNLEQCGLLRIEYDALDDLCADQSTWASMTEALASATTETRTAIATTLLDVLRRELAIKVGYLDEQQQEALRQRSDARLQGVWALEQGERLEYATLVMPRSRLPHDHRGFSYLSARGGFGQYLRRVSTFPGRDKLTLDETADVIADLFRALSIGGQVELVQGKDHDDPDRAYLLTAASMIWREGDGKPLRDPIRMPNLPEGGREPNKFFVDFYRDLAVDALGIEAREHTAQVPAAERMEREERFKTADLKILYCSPTMELGVDIAWLNVVNLRNVPPTPANYAQRSGRAGRNGSPALVFTYCTTGSPHDQFFFRRPALMVAGQVAPPRLDLANESLVRAHVHALWLAASQMKLGSSLRDVLDVDDPSDQLALRAWIADDLHKPKPRSDAKFAAERMLTGLDDALAASGWWNDGWLDATLNAIPQSFERACERWRGLYRAARKQYQYQSEVIGSPATPAKDRQQAKRLRAEAETQLQLLLADVSGLTQSDFYSYRYFASEGFLPGYSFPRLPLSAFIPGGRRIRDDAEFLNRPRFLAVSEFGPRALIYHEGARYEVNKVILPVAEHVGEQGEPVLTTKAKRCGRCGYLHPGADKDLCERCNAPLPAPLSGLFRMQNVSTRRRDRISSDEEERQREGFEVRTGVRFAVRNGVPSVSDATLEIAGEPVARLAYGDTATIWRINLGRRRRQDPHVLGFVLDVERGFWANESDLADGDDDTMPDEALGPKKQRVIPFVEDDRNCLIFEPNDTLALDDAEMASLTAALKQAIQLEFQLEDTELAAEALPDEQQRRALLFYEAAEGGAGVLRRIIDEPDAIARIARRALELCHFDSDTGVDQHRAPGAAEDCEAACYDCLMSYTNQPDHRILDRKAIQPLLAQFTSAKVSIAFAPHVEPLAQSELEREWLRWIEAHDLRLPDDGQRYIAEAQTRPDFVYTQQNTAIYVDGPHHDYPERADRDAHQAGRMRDLGWTVVRFGHADDWAQVVDSFRWVFGELSR
jgi:very-short-patch-repair endonuclease